MRGGAVILLLVITAIAAYSMGRHDAPSTGPAPIVAPILPNSPKPRTFVDAQLVVRPSDPEAAPSAKPTAVATPSSQPTSLPQQQEPKRKAEILLTAAAIAAILIQASRDQYHATGHPCACPDDLMRNGRRCGGSSAHSRAAGAAPLCYSSDVSADMIAAYKKRIANQ